MDAVGNRAVPSKEDWQNFQSPGHVCLALEGLMTDLATLLPTASSIAMSSVTVSTAVATAITVSAVTTTAMLISGGHATGLSITGTPTSTCIGIGVTGTPIVLTNGTHAVSIFTSTNALTGTVRAMEITHSMLTADLSTINEVMYIDFESSVSTGDWTNAIVGRINYTAPGNANGGMAAAICAEMSLMGAAQTGGRYYSLDCEIECPENFTCPANATYPVAFMKFGVWGDATAVNSFEAGGYLFHIDGVATGTDYLFEEVTVTAAAVFDAVLKINVGGADYFIGLCDDKSFT